jgi:hypothetical protein
MKIDILNFFMAVNVVQIYHIILTLILKQITINLRDIWGIMLDMLPSSAGVTVKGEHVLCWDQQKEPISVTSSS